MGRGANFTMIEVTSSANSCANCHYDIYQDTISAKAQDLNWLHFDDEPRETAGEGPTVPHIRFCNLSSNAK